MKKSSRRWVGAVCAGLLTLCVLTPVAGQTAWAAEATGAGVQIERVSLNIGADETQRNFNWQATSAAAEQVQVAAMPAGWKQGDAFPTAGVTSAKCDKGVANEANENRAGWYTFRATVEGLKADTTYLYRVGDGTTWSETYQFSTGDLGDGQSFSFMFAGDPQIGASGDNVSDTKGWTNTLDTMTKAFPDTDFLISAGDQINSGDPSTVESEYEGYFAPEVLHDLTLATNVGNHETYAGNGHYSYNFNMPNTSGLGAVDSTGDLSGDYWFTYNGTLFMSLNSNNMSTSEHRAFMENAIAANPDAEWKIVTFHHSVYSVADHTQDTDILQRRSELPVVFSDLGIDLVLMGHDHVYTRTYLMDGTTPEIPADGKAPATLTNPESGEVLYVTANSASGSKYYEIQNLPQNTFAAVQDQSKRENMTLVNVSADKLTVSTYYTDDAQVTSGDLLDTVTIERTEEPQQAETKEMFRLYNQWTGEHLYTANQTERDVLVTLGWTNEGTGWIAPAESQTPVYRLYNPYVTGGDHLYTTDKNEYDELAKVGWRQEGIGWYSADKDAGVPVYRQYNPYAETGTHNYSADKNENDTLVKLGWKAEGVAWYGVSEK